MKKAHFYRSAAMIFLRSNGLLKRKLEKRDIKRRLLGHWGTCAGLSFAYASRQFQHLQERLAADMNRPTQTT